MPDMNDIYRGTYGSHWGLRGEDMEYEDLMKEYSTLVQ
jgi:hypothetical protein